METQANTVGRDGMFRSTDIERITASTTLRVDQRLAYVVGAAAADITVTLPNAEEAAGAEFTLVYQTLTTAGYNAILAFPAGPAIKPANVILTQANQWVTVKSNGFAWFILASDITEGLYTGLRVASATWDFTIDGGAISAIDLNVDIPDNAVIIGGFVDVITTCVSASDAGTGALSVLGANDIVTALAISNGSNIWDAGLQPIIPKSNTPDSTGIKLTSEKAVTFTIAVEAFTAGKFILYLHWVPTIVAT